MAAVKMIVDGGYKIQEVASALGVHRTTVWRWFQHKETEKYYERYEAKKIRAMLREIEKEAMVEAEELSKKLDNPNPWEANAAANMILHKYSWIIKDLF